MRQFIVCFMWILLLLAYMPAFADEKIEFNISTILEQQHAIRSEAEGGLGKHASLSKSQKSELFQAQDKLFNVLQGKTSASDLSPTQQTEAFNSLNKISAILNGDDDRLVCERVKSVGSNRVERVCRTASERERERINAQNTLDSRRNVCGNGSTCSGL